MRTGAEVRVRFSVVVLMLAVVGPAIGAQTPSGPASALPDGAGAGIVRARCLSCHEADIIAGQRLTEAGWGREIDKMVRWGAQVPDPDRPILQAYLTAHFAPRPAASHDERAGGEAVFARACLSCHGIDLVESQRLSPAGWTREVEKMMRWGARVGEADKAGLVAFLAAKYPVR